MLADRRLERGSAAVEFALLLPILLLLLLALVQVGVIARDPPAHPGLARGGARGRRPAVGRGRRRRGPRGRRRSGPGTAPSRGCVERRPWGAGDGVRRVRRGDRVAARRVVVPRVRIARRERDDASGVRMTPLRAGSLSTIGRDTRGTERTWLRLPPGRRGRGRARRARDGRRGRRSVLHAASTAQTAADAAALAAAQALAIEEEGPTPRDLAASTPRATEQRSRPACEPGTFVATVSVRMAVGDLFLVGGDRTVLARARAEVDLPALILRAGTPRRRERGVRFLDHGHATTAPGPARTPIPARDGGLLPRQACPDQPGPDRPGFVDRHLRCAP